jgi:hypothetical protein
MSGREESYNIGAIRSLLTAAFAAEDLQRFCQDRLLFQPILTRFGPRQGLDDMVAEVINYCQPRLLFKDLLLEVETENERQYRRFSPYRQNASLPAREGGAAGRLGPARVFICYKRHAGPDRRLADHLHGVLTAQGHDVFVDTSMRTGTDWLEEIDRQIRECHYLVVLLSQESADSEMVQAEVSRAYAYRRQQGRPQTLPVRVGYHGMLPYAIDAYVSRRQFVVWENEVDDERVGAEVLAAIEGQPPARAPHIPAPAAGEILLSEDGRPVASEGVLSPPLPAFDPRFLEELEAPGGAVKLRDRFYVERAADARLKREVVRVGTTTTIRAARQTGKSSLLVRGVNHARQQGARVVALDLQRVPSDRLENPDLFLRDLAELLVRKLRLDAAEVEGIWVQPLAAQVKLTALMEEYMLPETGAPIVLALDEADRLLQTDHYSDFFALLRSWHNSRAMDELWDLLNIIMVISTEPYLLIPNANQSPFNVGLRLYLGDFDAEQVQRLNRQHGEPVGEADLAAFMSLFGGHPYLTRKALYTMVTERMGFDELARVAPTDQGPFGDHLRRHHWLLHDEPDLRSAMKEIARHERCADDSAFFRLLRAGLAKGSGEICRCRCDLYRAYFGGKL